MPLGKSLFLTLAAMGSMALVGCVYPPAKDGRSGEDLQGPIAMGDSRGRVLGACRSTFMYSGTCDLIFTDMNGGSVDGHDLARELDRTAKDIAPLSPWLSRSPNDMSRLPYELHILTIAPAVVLAVPVTPSSPRLNCSSVYEQGCIQSQGFRGQAYWYRAAIGARPGSFWFVPGGDKAEPIDATAAQLQIVSGSAVIQLSQEGGTWKVRRTK